MSKPDLYEKWFRSPYTGELIFIEPLKLGWRQGHNLAKNNRKKGKRGPDKKPRRTENYTSHNHKKNVCVCA